MKKVISGKELKEKMKETILLLCDTVSNTLGPIGNNVLINNSTMSPFITNDGVTIAENIESEDSVINTILEIAKEASLKTNEVVGDGTTTTLVLLKHFYLEGLKEIEKGKNGITLKKEWEKNRQIIKELLLKETKKPKDKDYISIASNSANDKELGKIIWNAYKIVKEKSSIRIEESKNEKTFFEIKKGYEIEINSVPDFFFAKKEEINLQNVKLLLIKNDLLSLEQISEIINETLNRSQTLLILAENIEEEIKQTLYFINKKEKGNIYFIEIPDYASRKMDILSDLEILTDAKIVDIELLKPEWENLGTIKDLKIKKTRAIFSVETNKEIKEYIKLLKTGLVNKDDYEREFIEERLAKIQKGICIISVGGITKTEKREKIARVEDAINAIEMSKKGIVIGEGLTYFKIAEKIKKIDPLIAKVLEKPLQTILENAGFLSQQIMEEIKKENFEVIYNIEKQTLEKIEETKIIDPKEVVSYALENALSIASMLLTTNSLVINDTIEKNEEI